MNGFRNPQIKGENCKTLILMVFISNIDNIAQVIGKKIDCMQDYYFFNHDFVEKCLKNASIL